MNIFLQNVLTYLLLILLGVGSEVVSNEKDYSQTDKRSKDLYTSKNNRRLSDNLRDEEWHVSHLKNLAFEARRSSCKEETFEEKALRYRKSLQSDGSLVEYVSADPIPVDKKDLVAEVCINPSNVKRIFQHLKADVEDKNNLQINDTDVKITKKTNNVTSSVDDSKKKARPMDKAEETGATPHDTKKKTRKRKAGHRKRNDDYAFSSIEYYDEMEEFDISVCPNSVYEITLELDHIRPYDVECQLIIEWRSLE